MTSDDPWSIRTTDEGTHVLYYKTRRWPMEPKAEREEVEAHLERTRRRYPGDSPEVLLGSAESADEQNGRQRGGPWRWTIPEAAAERLDVDPSGVMHTSRKKDAKAALRRRWDRQRLPNGITWELETG